MLGKTGQDHRDGAQGQSDAAELPRCPQPSERCDTFSVVRFVTGKPSGFIQRTDGEKDARDSDFSHWKTIALPESEAAKVFFDFADVVEGETVEAALLSMMTVFVVLVLHESRSRQSMSSAVPTWLWLRHSLAGQGGTRSMHDTTLDAKNPA